MSLTSAVMVIAFLVIVAAFAYTQPTPDRQRVTLKTGVGALLVFGVLATFRSLLVPFLLPLLIAYLMDPVLDWFEQRGHKRVVGIVIVYVAVVIAGITILLVIVPPVITQIGDIAKQLAGVDWAGLAEPDSIEDKLKWVVQQLPGGLDAAYKQRLNVNIETLVAQWQTQLQQAMPYVANAAKWLGERAGSLVVWAFSTVSGMFWLLLLPITLWYCLADFDRMRRRAWYIVPPERRPVVGELAGAVNRAIGGYLRGYALLCVLVGVTTTTLLLIMQGFFGFKYGLVIGVIAGCTYFIPYIGSLCSVLLGVVAIYFTGGYSLAEAAIGFVVLQASNSIYDNVINPKVIGQNTGLHPMLIMFALLAGGKLLGLAGVILATPALLCTKIILDFYFPRLSEPIPDDQNPDRIGVELEPPARDDAAEPLLSDREDSDTP